MFSESKNNNDSNGGGAKPSSHGESFVSAV